MFLKKVIASIVAGTFLISSTLGCFAESPSLNSQITKLGNGQELSTKILRDDEHFRIAESTDGIETTIATYNKDTEQLVIETTDKDGTTTKQVEDLNKIKKEAEEKYREIKDCTQVNDGQKYTSKGDTFGFASNRTISPTNYSYEGVSSWAFIECGDARPSMRVTDADVKRTPAIQRWYENFSDAIDSLISVENTIAVQFGAGTMTALVTLLAAPDVTITKAGAIVGAIGLTATATYHAINWLTQARTGDKYYDLIRSNK